jgi:hypothetical protein
MRSQPGIGRELATRDWAAGTGLRADPLAMADRFYG